MTPEAPCATRWSRNMHANLPALKAVLEHATTQRELAGIYHLGDVVGYAPWPTRR